MKRIMFIMLVLITLLAGCRAKKSVIDESSTVSITDTTKVITDSLTSKQTTTDTTKTATHVEQSAVIEFVDGGGTVSVDTAGNLTFNGVKSVKGNVKADTEQIKGVNKTQENTETHNEKANGRQISKREQRHNESETKPVASKWYQSILANIGGLCLIAVLLWILFLYLKRKF